MYGRECESLTPAVIEQNGSVGYCECSLDSLLGSRKTLKQLLIGDCMTALILARFYASDREGGTGQTNKYQQHKVAFALQILDEIDFARY